MSAVPFWSVITDKDSMRTAAPWKKALMFASGENATALCSLAAAYAVMATGATRRPGPVPGHRGLERGQHHHRRPHPQGRLRQGTPRAALPPGPRPGPGPLTTAASGPGFRRGPAAVHVRQL